jgi:cold-inducible RNA-binding protein
MEILKSIDLNFVISLLMILAVFGVLYLAATCRQKKAFAKVDESLKRQEQTNQQLNTVINELRRANRYLAELAEMEMIDGPQDTATAVSASPDNQYKLYVGNIDYTATESELAAYFAEQGKVASVNIPVNRYNGKARGFGFVTFSSREEAERAMSLHGTEFKGRQIQVNFAKERDLAS